MGNAKTTKKRKNRYNYSINRKKKMKKKAKRRIKIQSVTRERGLGGDQRRLRQPCGTWVSPPTPTKPVSIAGSTKKVKAPKRIVVKKLEEEKRRNRRRTRCVCPATNVKFCVYMLEKYDEDYVAMARDRKKTTSKRRPHRSGRRSRRSRRYRNSGTLT
uniref:Putative nucleolar protein 16 n=1 Tax=Ixodes ricinus TaxID=34613 RepID=A0A090X8S7_IXORI